MPIPSSPYNYGKVRLTAQSDMPDRLIKLQEVRQLVGLGKTIIYQMIGEGRFPAPYKISTAARWSEHEIRFWIEGIKAS